MIDKQLASKWAEMVSRSFSPRQWFDGEDRGGGDKPMWVYRKFEENTWTVGFFCPDGEWEPESDHPTAEAAAARVHWLNGGNP